VDTQAAASLLGEFKKVPGRISRPQTFMEIGGYPHYENVCSNFLAFFFDPEGPHGLSSLFLDALMGAVGVEGVEEGLGGNVSVEREVFTGAGNRIDLLIKSDSHAVLIENKIFAAVANPFEDYAAYLRSLKNESGDAYPDENKIKILLTLYPSGEGSEWGFANVTHADFAGAVRSALGHHVSGADTRYLTLMLDFLNTLENLGEGTRMNQEFINLLAERSEEVATFLRGITDVRTEVKKKALALGDRIGLQEHEDVLLLPWQPLHRTLLKRNTSSPKIPTTAPLPHHCTSTLAEEYKRCMLTSLRLAAGFSRGRAHPVMQPPIPTTHPHPAVRG
jgi:hypothetical protein